MSETFHGLTPIEEATRRAPLPPGDKVLVCRALKPVVSVLHVAQGGVFLSSPVESEHRAVAAGREKHLECQEHAGLGFAYCCGARLLTFNFPVADKESTGSDDGLESLCRTKYLLFSDTRAEFRDTGFYDEGFRIVGQFYFDSYSGQFVSGHDSKKPGFLVLQHDPKLAKLRLRRALRPRVKSEPKPKVTKADLVKLASALYRWVWGLPDYNEHCYTDTLCDGLSGMLAKFSIVHGPFAYRKLKAYLSLMRTYQASTSRGHLTTSFREWADEELKTPAVQKLLKRKKFEEPSFHYESSEFSTVYSRRIKREEAEKARQTKAGRKAGRKAAVPAAAQKGAGSETAGAQESGGGKA